MSTNDKKSGGTKRKSGEKWKSGGNEEKNRIRRKFLTKYLNNIIIRKSMKIKKIENQERKKLDNEQICENFKSGCFSLFG